MNWNSIDVLSLDLLPKMMETDLELVEIHIDGDSYMAIQILYLIIITLYFLNRGSH